ncbi:hypothetical protein E2I00_009649, partial [Balaenoptera physalus]
SHLGMESPARPAPAPAALLYYVAFSQLLGLAVVAMTGTWLGVYRGGIAWESALQFNVHPLCMIIGLVFLQGDALLVYRVFRNEAKRTTKILHGLLHVFAFVIALWLVGFSFFLFPGASFSLRSRYRPQHVFLGGAIFLLSPEEEAGGFEEHGTV